MPVDMLQVKGLTTRIKGLEDELERAMREAEKARDMVPSRDRIASALDEVDQMFQQGVRKILNDCEQVYVKSMVDPFHPDSMGTRIPTLNPVDTWTHSQFDTISVNVAGHSPTGKTVLIFNPLALSTAPVLIIDDPSGQLPPLDSQAPFVKNVKTYDGFASHEQLRTYAIYGMQVPGKRIYDYLQIPVAPITS